MFVYNLLDGGVVFVEGGGEWGAVASVFGFVNKEVVSVSCCRL